MLKLLLGRAGTGKTDEILKRIAAAAGQRQLLIVPEQASHETERRLCAVAGNQVSLYAEVLSFTRLTSRVLAQSGGLAAPALDPGGRVLLMCAARKAVSSALTVYARPSQKPAFLSGLLATLDECKQYCVSPQDLTKAGEELPGQEGEKLRDLGLIFGAYDALTAQVAADPRDRLTRLAEGLGESGWAKGISVYVDGFTDFTPQQLQVMRQLWRQAREVTVVLTCAPEEEGERNGVFAPARRTIAQLRRVAKEDCVAVELEGFRTESKCKVEELSYIEKYLFSEHIQPWKGPVEGVCMFTALTPRSEVEWTASEILRLVREKGIRFREIGVVVRGFDTYSPLIEEVFGRYGVPVFLDSMTDILQKPVFAVVIGALDVVAGDYDTGDVFRYLKTGLTGISRGDCDILENYSLRWNLKGSRWTAAAPWNMHPRGYGFPMTEEDQALLDHLDQVRRQIVEPLEELRHNKDETGEGQAIALYRFLEKIQLPQRLAERSQALRERGELKRAEEYGQLWEILCGGLEQCASILSRAPLSLEEFAQLLKLVLSQYDVGAIPVSLDRVTAGDAARLGDRQCTALFFLGADDSALPQVTPAPGLFTDDDRSLLASMGLELSPQLSDKLDREMTIVYAACARPDRYLTVSWAASGPQGEERRPSFLWERLRLLFPEVSPLREQALGEEFRLAAPRPALELAGERVEVLDMLKKQEELAPLAERLVRGRELKRGCLCQSSVACLYGRKVPMSASRMDKYRSCHFSYFMQFGLKAKPRQPAGFQAPEYGTFVHYVLEHMLKDATWKVEDGNGGWTWDEGMVRRQIKAIMETYIAQELGGLENKTPRFVYLFNRLIRPVTQVVENVLEELSVSSFQPISFELGFGDRGDLPPVELAVDGVTVSVSGFVDRVDGWVHDGRLYLRVVDYKTGRKSFDLTEVWNGLGLQMLLYLFTLEEKGESLYHYAVTPAGVLYLPARAAVAKGSRSMTERERQKQTDAELRRHGLILDDPEVLEAMEAINEGGPRFLPVKVSSRTGTITGEALVTAERLGKLKRHTQRILSEIAGELASGVIDADPYWRGPEKNACLYCDYGAACHFEDGRGSDRRRYLPTMDGETFWASVDEEEPENI